MDSIVESEIGASVQELADGLASWAGEWNIREHLERIWDPGHQSPQVASALSEPAEDEIEFELSLDEGASDRPAPPERHVAPPCPAAPVSWSIGLTPSFQKSIKGVDKKLQGRILEAVVALCSRPTTPQGDTVKPLEGDLGGLWRYRIGDYRLVYKPDAEDGRIVLLYFSSRGSAYA